MVRIAMAVAHLLDGSYPIDCGALSNFSMQIKCTISLPDGGLCAQVSLSCLLPPRCGLVIYDAEILPTNAAHTAAEFTAGPLL